MKSHIIISSPAENTIDQGTITLEQVIKRKVMRRRRVAKRMAKRFPLFAVEYMQTEFPGYTQEQFIEDISRKTRKGKSKRKAKGQLKRQGRYPLFQKAMANYSLTKEQKYLEEAQRWRNRLYLPFELIFGLNGERRSYIYPPETSLRVIEALSKIEYSSWDEFEKKKAKVLRYAHIS